MIHDYKPSDKKNAELIARELLAVLSLCLLYPFGMFKSKRKTKRKKEQRTIVLLHGYIANKSNFYPLATYLKLKGHNVLFYDYPSRHGVEKAAINFREYLRKHVKGGRIDLICHSMGGIVARIYLQLLGGSRRVDQCITLGSPHKGTYNAYWIPTKVGDELRPDSKLIKKLYETQDNSNEVKITSIIAGSDNIIIPRVNSSYEKSIHIPHTGHNGLLLSPKVMSTIAQCLKAG
jgi:triacylglycerol lipase